MSQIEGYLKKDGDRRIFHHIGATELPDGTYALKVDTEIDLDSANLNISNIKIGSVDQTKNSLRFLKVMDDGSLVVVSDPLSLYVVADIDDKTGNVHYFGYTDANGGWYIIKEDKSTPTPSYRFFRGNTGYAVEWGNRAIHAYDYYYVIF